MHEAFVPLCMSTMEFRRWQDANDQCAGNEAAYPCIDCTAPWREAHEAVGECNEPEHPSGQLGLDLFHAA